MFLSQLGIRSWYSVIVICAFILGCKDAGRNVVSYNLEHRLTSTEQTLDIILRNPFIETVTLDGFRTSCACSQPRFETVEIAPQSQRIVTITLDTNRMASSMPNGGLVQITPILKSFTTGRVSDGCPLEITFRLTRGLVCNKPYVYCGLGQPEQHCDIESTVPVRLEIYSNVDWLNPTCSTSNRLDKIHDVCLELVEMDEYQGNSEATITFKAFDIMGEVFSSLSIIAKRVETCPLVLDCSVFESDKSEFIAKTKFFVAPGFDVKGVSCRSHSVELRSVSPKHHLSGNSVEISVMGPAPFKDEVLQALLLFEFGLRTFEVPVYFQFRSIDNS